MFTLRLVLICIRKKSVPPDLETLHLPLDAAGKLLFCPENPDLAVFMLPMPAY